MSIGDNLQAARLEMAGVERTFLVAPAPDAGAPLLLVLHGTGSTGKHMAAITGLAKRAPAAGIAAVFPDGLGKAWDGGREMPGREAIDDATFLVELVARLVDDGTARARALFVVGISNGAFFAEHLARHGLLPVRGLVLVAGTATEDSRQRSAIPAQRAALLCFCGTTDPVVPYGGGPIGANGRFGQVLTRLATNRGEVGGARLAVAAEAVATDWAALNADSVGPTVEHLGGELPVSRLSWSAANGPPVVVYRIEGGGHTWPGGPQYLAPELIGRVAHDLDATGLLLEFALRELARPMRSEVVEVTPGN